MSSNRPTADAGRFRAVPERSPDFAHLSLDGLRAYRRALSTCAAFPSAFSA